MGMSVGSGAESVKSEPNAVGQGLAVVLENVS